MKNRRFKCPLKLPQLETYNVFYLVKKAKAS